jgi:TctA family transporter
MTRKTLYTICSPIYLYSFIVGALLVYFAPDAWYTYAVLILAVVAAIVAYVVDNNKRKHVAQWLVFLLILAVGLVLMHFQLGLGISLLILALFSFWVYITVKDLERRSKKLDEEEKARKKKNINKK